VNQPLLLHVRAWSPKIKWIAVHAADFSLRHFLPVVGICEGVRPK